MLSSGAGGFSPSLWYIFMLALLVVFFTYFYTAIQFDPERQAEMIQRQGGFIPGIRPGRATVKLPGAHPQPHHAARLRCTWPSVTVLPSLFGYLVRDVPVGLESGVSILIVSGCGPRDHEADREPADDAQLRGLPQLIGSR